MDYGAAEDVYEMVGVGWGLVECMECVANEWDAG